MKLLDGMKTVAVAAPAPNGDPLVGPMGGWFLHGKFFFSSSGDSVDAVFRDHYGGSAFDWSDEGVY